MVLSICAPVLVMEYACYTVAMDSVVHTSYSTTGTPRCLVCSNHIMEWIHLLIVLLAVDVVDITYHGIGILHATPCTSDVHMLIPHNR